MSAPVTIQAVSAHGQHFVRISQGEHAVEIECETRSKAVMLTADIFKDCRNRGALTLVDFSIVPLEIYR